jgi:hypothetical protein
MPTDGEVRVVTEALHKEAAKWRGMSDKAEDVRAAADRLDLALSAFFVGDVSPGLHWQAYNEVQTFMTSILAGAVVEFEQLGGALVRAADAYDSTDRGSATDLNKIYGSS